MTGAEKSRESNDHINSDKDYILRAKDIIPPFRKQAETTGPASAQENTQTGKVKIPKFDLAEQIMAKQRKIVANKRKGPSQKNQAQSQKLEAELTGPDMEKSPSTELENRIITDIVARDIEKLLAGF